MSKEKKPTTTTKKLIVGTLFEHQVSLNGLFSDTSLSAVKKKLMFRARRTTIDLLKEYNEIRKSTLEKHSTAEINGQPFNGYRDKKAMKAFEKEMDPLANEEVKIKFPDIKIDELDINSYSPAQLDDLVELGLVKDETEE